MTPSKTAQEVLGGDLPPSPRAYPHSEAETSTQRLRERLKGMQPDEKGVLLQIYNPKQVEINWVDPETGQRWYTPSLCVWSLDLLKWKENSDKYEKLMQDADQP